MFCITSSFFKYPHGWQVRVYNQIVGIKSWEDEFYYNYDYYSDEFNREPVWDVDLQEYVQCIPDPKKTWLNPFTDQYERPPRMVEDIMEDEKKRKERSIRSSMGRTVNSIYHIARSNSWEWFITFTFNPELVNSLDYTETVKKLSKWLNNIKTENPGLGYIIVPEMHKSGRFHFHGLFKNCGGLQFTPSGKKTPKGDPIYNVGRYKYGWTTATRVTDQSRVTKYIAKYINKELCQVAFNKKRYWASRNLDQCDVQEVILDNEKMKKLKEKLAASAVYVKKVETAEIVTTYYEIGKEVLDDEI